MNEPLFLSVSDLPSRPDPDTGEPRPPRAPGFNKNDKPAKELDRNRDRRLSRKPSPPEGQGPVLEWYGSSQRWAILVGAGAFGVITAGIVVVQGFDLRWMSAWYVWAIILVGSFCVYTAVRSSNCSVGAEWLQEGKAWVRLYELTSIKAKVRSNAIHLDLKDRYGRELQVSSSDIQEDRDMWDLTYNGMLHSIIAGGAKTNGMVHSAFDLPRPHDRP